MSIETPTCWSHGCDRPGYVKSEAYGGYLCGEHAAAGPVVRPDPSPSSLESVNLTAAAHRLIETWDAATTLGGRYSHHSIAEFIAMEKLWCDLTGTDDTDGALNLARAIISASEDVHAHVAPF